MSFFRNIRSSIAGGRSSRTSASRDPTPNGGQRRDSIESRTDSLLNRSDTFILGVSTSDEENAGRCRSSADEQWEQRSHSSNTSSLEKKSKKSKVLSKFSTFTKRPKKNKVAAAAAASGGGGGGSPDPGGDGEAYEHHPSDNATNTYYKWKNEGLSNLDYDAQADPFNFLYEQPSSLKAIQQQHPGNGGGSYAYDPAVGGATYRKPAKMLHSPLREQMDLLKSTTKEEEPEEEERERQKEEREVLRRQQEARERHKEEREARERHQEELGRHQAELRRHQEELGRHQAERKRHQEEKERHQEELRRQQEVREDRELHQEELRRQQEEREDREHRGPLSESDKYKTVTLNSFRKSFRERFLQQQNEAPHNPAWFVEVEAPASEVANNDSRKSAKENRPDFLVFSNDDYRPQSRSPVRERRSSRSPVKRNETFRVERPMSATPTAARRCSPTANTTSPPPSSSIRVEIKNSISPHMPGRIVPVGVAKPMPATISLAALPHQGAVREQWHPSKVAPAGRYQTLVQISGNSPASSGGNSQTSSGGNSAPSSGVNQRLGGASKLSYGSTKPSYGVSRIRVNGGGGGVQEEPLPKSVTAIGSRYSLASASPLLGNGYSRGMQQQQQRTTGFSTATYKKPASVTTAAEQPTKAKPKSRTYFGDSQQPPQQQPLRNTSSAYAPAALKTASVNATENPANYLQTSRGATANGGGGGYSFASRRYPVAQSRCTPAMTNAATPMQRRSRSPIKMPWR